MGIGIIGEKGILTRGGLLPLSNQIIDTTNTEEENFCFLLPTEYIFEDFLLGFLTTQEIKDYIDENLFEEYTIPALCKRFTIDREHLQAGFRALVQSTVHGYILRQRIALAAKRLLETDDSIKEIALDSGFKKQRSFSRTFRAIFQKTPVAYREKRQNIVAKNNTIALQ